jgi:uncharacterized protein (DUF305 family)
MGSSRARQGAAAACVLALLTACGSAPREATSAGTRLGEPPRPDPAVAAAVHGSSRYVEADAHFMRHMIAHHRQALEMTALVPDRSARSDVRTLARRIELSQDDEIRQMERWLQQRGAPLADGDAARHGHEGHQAGAGAPAALMPGMLTAEQLANLADASGPEFDRLFLEYMVFHHEGAIAMVAELLASEGAAQDTEVFQFAAHVESDQRIEIARMRRIMSTLP